MKYLSFFLTLLVIGCTSTNVLKTNNNHCSYALSDTLIGYIVSCKNPDYSLYAAQRNAEMTMLVNRRLDVMS